MNREQKFFNALRDVFVGAKIEGESGYINLMRIKSRYYTEGVFPRLQHDINEALKPFPAFREELFEKLYDFFHRYFSESGSIYFRYTPLHQNVYEKVYTDDKDVMLFWKTHMLYYVKTDRLFKSMEAEVDGQKFFFDASSLEHKKANEKRDLVYAFKEKRKDLPAGQAGGALVFTVAYSERGKKTRTDDILKTLRKNGDKINEDTLERAFRVFEKQSEVDFFLNKDAKAFLEDQFDLWMYQYVFKGESQWTETRIRQLQTLKDIAFKIIAFISQFEDELVKIWNKTKFVINSNYVITLDRIAEKDGGLAVVEKLLAHRNFKAQVGEWRQLGIVDDSFKKTDVLEEDLTGKRLTKRYEHLPIDTKHFKDMELEILALFDNLDASLDGWLIKSENYQALNTILPKFKEKVQTIYIDPPYNTGNDGFIYEDQYQRADWLAMMQNRLEPAKGILRNDGTIFVSIDNNSAHNLKHLMDQVFENSLMQVVWHSKYTISNDVKFVSQQHEYVMIYAKNIDALQPWFLPRTDEMNQRYDNPDEDPRGPWKGTPLHAKSGTSSMYREYKFKNGFVWRCPEGRYPRYSPDSLKELDGDNRIHFPIRGREPVIKTFLSEVRNRKIGSLWGYDEFGHTHEANEELAQLVDKGKFDNPKPTKLVANVARLGATAERAIVMDFFAGSGTTAHAVINLNRQDSGKRKYILVEMADYFDTVMLPRIKKVVFSDKWKEGKAQNGQGIGHFCKYYHLEQYEDALRRAKYADSDLFDDPYRDPYHQYIFLRDLKMLEALEVDTKKNTVKVDLSKLYDGIDIAETLSNLTGKWIKRITANTVEFEDGEVVDMKNLEWKQIKPLIWW